MIWNNLISENRHLRNKLIYLESLVEDSKQDILEARKLRHDYKDHLYTLLTLLSETKYEQAIDYISQMITFSGKRRVFIRTENPVLDAIVNSKLSSASQHNIRVSCVCTSNLPDVKYCDLVSLLANLLNNAILACLYNGRKDNQIILFILSDEFKNEICVKNTMDRSVLKDNPYLCSTKKDKSNHGLGTAIVRDIAKKYSGACDFYEEDGFFCCNVILLRPI